LPENVFKHRVIGLHILTTTKSTLSDDGFVARKSNPLYCFSLSSANFSRVIATNWSRGIKIYESL